MEPPDYTEQNTKTVPFRRVMKDPQKATLQWVGLAHSFSFGDYIHSFPFHIELDDKQRDDLQQYIDRCSAMAQCDPLWGDYSSTWISNSERPLGHDFNIISEHDMRTVCLTFRQLYGNDEPGMTYQNASNLIQRLTREQLDKSEFAKLNETYLNPLRQASLELQVKFVRDIFNKLLIPDLPDLNHPSRERFKNNMNPEKLISVMFYGRYIHADKHATFFKQLESNPSQLQQLRFRFLEQVGAFTLTYLSFGEMILALARGNGLRRPIHRTDHQTDFSFDG